MRIRPFKRSSVETAPAAGALFSQPEFQEARLQLLDFVTALLQKREDAVRIERRNATNDSRSNPRQNVFRRLLLQLLDCVAALLQ
jgi:hypothetical protein